MNPYKNMSDADFAKFQNEREEYKSIIKDLEVQLAEAKAELRYWMGAALTNARSIS